MKAEVQSIQSQTVVSQSQQEAPAVVQQVQSPHSQITQRSPQMQQLIQLQAMANGKSIGAQRQIVQQKEEKVKPTLQLKGVAIHDDMNLERRTWPLQTPVAQRTIYKIASKGPKQHEEDPQRYATRTGDPLVETSLHLPEAKEIDMKLATSPMTIFIHGGALAKKNAKQFHEFLKQRGYVAGQVQEIVFITCSGATQMDEFLVSKGQALADELDATVYLAKGNVTINEKGVPIVHKENGTYAIQSEEEMRRIVPKEAEGWAKYAPQAIKYKDLVAVIRKAKVELLKYSKLGKAIPDVIAYRDVYTEIVEDLEEDRSGILRHYNTVQENRRAMDQKYGLHLAFYTELCANIVELQAARTTKHQAQVQTVLAKFMGMRNRINKGEGDLEGYRLLFERRKGALIGAVRENLAEEEMENAENAWGVGGDLLADLKIDLPPADANPTPAAPASAAASSAAAESVLPASKPKDGQATVSLKRIENPTPVVQRVIIDLGGTLTDHRTLSELLEGLPNLDLVRANKGIDLELKFADIGPHALTSVIVDGKKVHAPSFINAQTAKKHFKIVIELNKNMYKTASIVEAKDQGNEDAVLAAFAAEQAAKQKDRLAFGSLIETVVHEWTLHGQQHAVNINAARHQLQADVKIDHEAMLTMDMTAMDFAMALKAQDPKYMQYAPAMLQTYFNDVGTHVNAEVLKWMDAKAGLGDKLNGYFKNLDQLLAKRDGKDELAADLYELSMSWSYHTGKYEDLETAQTVLDDDFLDKMNLAEQKEVRRHAPPSPLNMILGEIMPLLRSLSATRPKAVLAARRNALAMMGVQTNQVDLKGASEGADDPGVSHISSSSSKRLD